METETCASYTEALKHGVPVLEISPLVLAVAFLSVEDCNPKPLPLNTYIGYNLEMQMHSMQGG